MTRKFKQFVLQFSITVLVVAGIIVIDQTSRANAKAVTEVTQVTEETTLGCGGISKALSDMRRGLVKVEKKKTKVKKKKSVQNKPVDENDLYILAHVIDGEGRGQDEAFKWLVGAVVLNRVKADIYPNSVESVVFQSGQYACTWDGNYNREPEESSWIIAEHLLRWGVNENEMPASVTGQSAAKQGKVWLEYKCNNGVTCYFCHNKYLLEEGE